MLSHVLENKGDSTTSQSVPHQSRTNRSSITGAPHYMSTDTTTAPTSSTPQVAINDIGSEEDFLTASRIVAMSFCEPRS